MIQIAAVAPTTQPAAVAPEFICRVVWLAGRIVVNRLVSDASAVLVHINQVDKVFVGGIAVVALEVVVNHCFPIGIHLLLHN